MTLTPFNTWNELINWFIANCFSGTANGFAKYRPITLRVKTLTGDIEACAWNGHHWNFDA